MHIVLLFFWSILIPPFILFAGGTLAVAFISVFVYKPKQLQVDEYEKNYLYLWKYDDKFCALSDRVLNEDELNGLKLLMIEEETPDGNVTMTYNHEMSAFWYYTKNKNIAFKYLEVAAQNFVIKYDCKSVFIIDDEHNDQISDENNENDNDEVDKIVLDAVFVQPKRPRTKQIKIKKTNRFTYKGSEYVDPTLLTKRRISFFEFKNDKKNI